jgi:hypothetical protein
MACVPGTQQSCACIGGAATGIQICRTDGTGFESCFGCPDQPIPDMSMPDDLAVSDGGDHCSNGAIDPGESDIDCGGSCPPCSNGLFCNVPGDCKSGMCVAMHCAPKGTPKISLGVPTGYAAGTAPNWIALGDLDKDGKLDVAVADYFNTVAVLLGNGKGAFSSTKTYPLGQMPVGVALADFDGDGRLDLASASPADGTVVVLPGKGDGTLLAARSSKADSTTLSLAAGDLNGDGKIDLVTTGSGGSVGVLLNDGTGSFTQTTFSAGIPYWAEIADLDGDQVIDLAIADSGGNQAVLMRGSGNGIFKPLVNLPSGHMPQWLAIGDFNGDKKPDLVTSNFGDFNDTLSLFLAKGGGAFNAPKTLNVSAVNAKLIAVDLNGDGSLDLVVGHGGAKQVGILLGNGDGTFGLEQLFDGGNTCGVPGVGDLDGDQRLDVLIADLDTNMVNVLLNQGP